MTTKPTITRVNIYRAGAEWCYAAFAGAEFDHSDVIGVPDDASVSEARSEMAAQFPDATIARVDDVA